MEMSETSEEIINLSSEDETIISRPNVSVHNVHTSKLEKSHDYVCISCINKSLTNPGESMNLNCLSCTLSNSDPEGNTQYWCYICNNLASRDCHAANHNIEIYNDYYHAQSLLIKSNINQTNLACDEELQDCQKTQDALQTIIAWIKVLRLEMTQRDSSSISASYLCQVFIAQLESLKTAGVFCVAEKEGSGILNYINQLTTHFSDRLTQIQAAQTKVRNLLDNCRFLPESSQSSQFSNSEHSSDLVNAITTALNSNNNSCVDVLFSLLKGEPNLGNAPKLDSRNSKITDNLEETVEVTTDEVGKNRLQPFNLRYPKRRADEEADTVKISKKRRELSNLGPSPYRERDYDHHEQIFPFTFGTETQRHAIPTSSVETISKEVSGMIGSGFGSANSYFAKFDKIRSELAQNFQEAQVKLKILEEGTIVFANEATNLPEKMAKRITELEVDVASMVEKVKSAKESEAKARQEVSSLLKHAKEVQEKYENELIRHTTDVGQLNAVLEEMDKLEQSHSLLQSKLALLQRGSFQQETKFVSEQTSWQAQKELLGKESFEKDQRCVRRKRMIEALQKQVTQLNSRIASATRCQEVVLRALSGEDTNPPLDFRLSDDEIGILDQPLKMVRCLRDEKNVAVARCEVLETELQSLKTQLKETEGKSVEFQATLCQGLEDRKVLIDSDRMHSDEDGLAGRVKELTAKVSSLVSELESSKNINQQSSCDLEELSEKNKMLRIQISSLKTKTDILQGKLEEETNTLAEMKQTNMQLIAAKLELEQESAVAKEAAQKSQSSLVEALALLEKKSSIALDYKSQYENLKTEHEKLVEEHEETCAVQSTRIQELETSIIKINFKLEEIKKKNLIQEKLRRKVQSFMEERNLSNPNEMPQLVPINISPSPTSLSANFSDYSRNENQEQLQLFSSVKEINSNPVIESRSDDISFVSAKSCHSEVANEEAIVNPQSFKLFDREFEVFVHAQNCQRERKEPKEECAVRFCHPMKIVLKHSTSCHAGELCPVPDCWFSLAYQSEEVCNKITRLESDLLLIMEHAELAEESEAAAHQEASNQVKLAMEDREKYENKLLQRSAEIEKLNIVVEQSRSQLAAALEELSGRPTLDETRILQSQKETVQTQLEQTQKEVEHVKLANLSEMKELEERVRLTEKEIMDLLSREQKLETHKEQIKQSQTKLIEQLTESQQINTQLVEEKQDMERKLRTAKEEIKDLQSQKESIQMQLERLKQSQTSLAQQLVNSQQKNTQLIATIQELEERNRIANEEIRDIESHKELLQTELEELEERFRIANEEIREIETHKELLQTGLEGVMQSQLTEYQHNNNQLIEAKLDLEDKVRVAKEESQKLLSDKNALREKLSKTVHEVTQLRQMAVEYDELKNCYDKIKQEHMRIMQERDKFHEQVGQLSTKLEEAERDNQVERLHEKSRLETIQENQQNQQNASVTNTAAASILKSCNKVLNWNQQPIPVNPIVKVAPSASVVASAGGSTVNHDSGKKSVCVEAEDNEKSRRLFTTRHCILNHARRCQLRQSKSKEKCHVPLCWESSVVLNHIAKCKAGASCIKPHCLSSQKRISYWKNCKKINCRLCYSRPCNIKSTTGVAVTEVTEVAVETSCSPLQQVTGGQFCSTKRFEFLAMAMLTQLHNNRVNQFVYPCNYCKSQVETRLRCNVCSTPDFDFELCIPCYNKNGHSHLMDVTGFSLEVDSPNSNQTNSSVTDPIQSGIQSLVHSLECLDPNCHFLFCHRIKSIVNHMRSCEASVCRICCQLVALIIYHAKHNCSETKSSKECTVPFCHFLNRRIASSANMSIQSAFGKLAYVTRAKNSGNEDRIGDTRSYRTNSMDVPPQPKKIGKKTPTKKVNPQLILPSELCKYSEFGIY